MIKLFIIKSGNNISILLHGMKPRTLRAYNLKIKELSSIPNNNLITGRYYQITQPYRTNPNLYNVSDVLNNKTNWSSYNLSIRTLTGTSGTDISDSYPEIKGNRNNKRSNKVKTLKSKSLQGTNKPVSKVSQDTASITKLKPVKTKPKLKVADKKKFLPGQIGDAKLVIYAPFFFQLLEEKIPLAEIEDIIEKTVLFHDNLIKNHGIKDGTKQFKEITLYCTNLLEGTSPRPLFNVSIGKVDRWPKAFTFLRQYFHEIRDYGAGKFGIDRSYILALRRFILTLFKINRVCCQYSNLDVSSIKAKVKLDPKTVSEFQKFVNSLVDRRICSDNHKDLALCDIRPVFGPSKGPNGVPKEDSSYAEAYVICSDENKSILEGIETIVSFTRDPAFIFYLKNCARQYKRAMLLAENNLWNRSEIKIIKDPKLRKLQAIPDKGNKSRTIAICDFWTQCVLSLLEDLIIKFTMKVFKNECSFYNHSQGFEEINRQNPDLLDQLISIDASDWTDNLPASLQVIVMERLFGTHIAQAWADIAVRCAWNIGNTQDTVHYGKGQGMGTKGSFAIAQLTNLLFIKFLYKKHYPEIASPFFREVGDDMVIQDPNSLFAAEFEAIGVPINLNKTKRRSPSGTFVEFVSRNSWDGIDYSIISPNLMLKYRSNDFYILTLLQHLNERGINVTLIDLFIYKYGSNITEKGGSFTSRVRNIILIAHLFNISGIAKISLGVSPDELNQLFTKEVIVKALNGLALLLPSIYHLAKLEGDSQIGEFSDELASTLTDSVYLIKSNNTSLSHLALVEGWSIGLLKKIFAYQSLSESDFIPSNSDNILPLIKTRYMVEIQPDLDGPIIHNCYNCFTINPLWINLLVKDIYKTSNTLSDVKIARNLSITDKANTKAYLKLMGKLNAIFSFELQSEKDKITGFSFNLKGKPENIKLNFAFNILQQRYKTLDHVKAINLANETKYSSTDLLLQLPTETSELNPMTSVSLEECELYSLNPIKNVVAKPKSK